MSTASSAALSSSVLLLNRQYVAIHVVDVRRAFQRAQGRAHAARSRHQADKEAGAPQAQPATNNQARQPEVRKLEDVPRQRVLVGGLEIDRCSSIVVDSSSIQQLITNNYRY